MTVNPLPTPTITAGGPIAFCQGGSVTLTCTAGTSYLWSDGEVTQSITRSTSGIYTVTLTDANGCIGTSAPITITVNALPTPTITASGPITFCTGGSVTLTCTAGSSYLWSDGEVTQSIIVTTSGTYTVTLTDANGCVGTSAAITVTVNNGLVPTITAGGPTTFCQGGSVTLTASAGATYLWSDGEVTQSITVTTSGNYTVNVTDINGCSGNSAATVVTVNPLPTPTITAGGPITFCQGGSVTLTCTAGASYLWSDGEVTQSITVNASGTYTVTLTDANGCVGTSAPITVTVNALPTPTIMASGPTTFCTGGSVTLTCTAGASYLWSDGEITQSIIVTTSGTYTVTLTDVNGCVGTSAGITVTVNNGLIPTITAGGPTTFCQGGSVTLTASAGATYLWSTGAITQSITVTTSGNYTVNVTDINGCSGNSAATVVTVNPLPTPTITAGGPKTFCQGGSVTLTCTAGASYLWSTGAITQSITVTTSGTYTVTMTDANGCVGTTAGTTVTVHPLPTPTITTSGATTFCAGGSVTLTCSAGTSYLWSTGAVTQSITVNASGNYSVAMTDANGCVGTTAATAVTVNPLPTPTITASGPVALCTGGSVTLTCTAGTSYVWSTGAVTQSITVTVAGTYSVIMTNANGCVGTSPSTTVTVDVIPVVSLGPDQTLCGGQTAILNAGNAGDAYLWSTGANTQTITINTSGAYWVQVTNGACSARDTVNIAYNTGVIVNLGPDIVNCGGGSAVTLDAGNPGMTYVWSTDASTKTITPTKTGSYWVRVENTVNGCFGYDTIKVVIGTPINLSLGNDTTICQGDQLVIEAGKQPYTYFWTPGGENTHFIIVTQPGRYVCDVTDSNGCTASSIKMVTEFCPTDMYVPSGFAPDGTGGKNVTFMAYCNGVVEFHMSIYDRWGSLVFETTDITTGWDGTINGNVPVQGVYVYVIDYKVYASNVELHKHTKTGTVTLIK